MTARIPATMILALVDELRRAGALDQHLDDRRVDAAGDGYFFWFAIDTGPLGGPLGGALGFDDSIVRAAWNRGLLAGGAAAPDTGRKRVTLKPAAELAAALAALDAEYKIDLNGRPSRTDL